MTRIKRFGSKQPPDGWQDIEPTLNDITDAMREAERAPHDGRRRCESIWPIMRYHHQRSRYIYELYYKKGEISSELYNYCIKEKWADAGLIAKWKKEGYEKLCCLQCIQTGDQQFLTTCICRVPKKKREQQRVKMSHFVGGSLCPLWMPRLC